MSSAISMECEARLTIRDSGNIVNFVNTKYAEGFDQRERKSQRCAEPGVQRVYFSDFSLWLCENHATQAVHLRPADEEREKERELLSRRAEQAIRSALKDGQDKYQVWGWTKRDRQWMLARAIIHLRRAAEKVSAEDLEHALCRTVMVLVMDAGGVSQASAVLEEGINTEHEQALSDSLEQA